jgi:hypothetical protein
MIMRLKGKKKELLLRKFICRSYKINREPSPSLPVSRQTRKHLKDNTLTFKTNHRTPGHCLWHAE